MPALIFTFALLIIWQFGAMKVNAAYILPTPIQILEKLWELREPLFTAHLPATMTCTGIGLLISIVLGVALSIIMDMFPIAEKTLYPVMIASQTIPTTALAPLFDRVPSAWGLVISLALFALTYSVPLTRYPVEGLAWLGLPSPSFASGDYYPLMPFFFIYLAGRFVARLADEHWPDGYPAWMYRDWMPPLTAVGHASLVIYLVHQPILLLLTELIGH